jgi:hypothetical protein
VFWSVELKNVQGAQNGITNVLDYQQFENYLYGFPEKTYISGRGRAVGLRKRAYDSLPEYFRLFKKESHPEGWLS